MQDAEGHGQIVAGAGLFEIGRRQVDRYPPVRKLVAAVLDRRLYPVLALAHRPLGQADGGKGGQTEGYVHLDGDRESFDTDHGAADNFCKHLIVLPLLFGNLEESSGCSSVI